MPKASQCTGSWIYIGTQGILQGTYETLAAVANKNFGGSLTDTITLGLSLICQLKTESVDEAIAVATAAKNEKRSISIAPAEKRRWCVF